MPSFGASIGCENLTPTAPSGVRGESTILGSGGTIIDWSFFISIIILLAFSMSSLSHPGVTYPALVLAKLLDLSLLFSSAL